MSTGTAGSTTYDSASSPGLFAVAHFRGEHNGIATSDQSQLLPLFSLTDDLISSLTLSGGAARQTEEMSSPPRGSSPSSSGGSSDDMNRAGRAGGVTGSSQRGSGALASLDASGVGVAPMVYSHSDPPALHRAFTTGLNLNVAPSNWLTRDEKHLAHLSSLPWHPVTSGFSMVEYFSSLALKSREWDTPPLSTLNNADPKSVGIVPKLDSGEPIMSHDGGHAEDNAPLPAWGAETNEEQHGREVPDFLCSANQLKTLLSSSVTGEALSFVVHRVGPSIILEGATTPAAPKSVKQARHDALRSKLLYYSILADSNEGQEGRLDPRLDGAPINPPFSCAPRHTASSANGGPAFSRSLHWKIADLSLMLGVNVPVVVDRDSGEELTLQVHDERDFITKADAVDMWLDSIMANVSGAAICFHRDGVVQGYQVVPTQDLPNLAASGTFEPLSIQRDATNVLRWLKQECSQTGSYVIIKEPHESTLKLYDVSSWHVSSSAAQQGDAERVADHLQEQRRDTKPIEGTVDEADSPLLQPCRHHAPHPAHTTLDCTHAEGQQDPLRPFAMPMAMMCFRMAQCLRNSDAECLRLYQKVIAMIPEETRDARALLPLATAHAQCMNHYHSSSPLSESESLTVSHGKSALRVVTQLLLMCSNGKDLNATTADEGNNSKQEHDEARDREMFQSLVGQVDVISASVSRCFCALTLQHVRQRRYVDVVEMIAAVEQSMRIRIVCASQAPLTNQPQGGSGKADVMSDSSDDDPPALHLLRQQLAATSLQLLLAIGDFCLDLYRDAIDGHLTDVFIQDLTLHARFASIQKDLTRQLVDLNEAAIRRLPGGGKLLHSWCGGDGAPSLAQELEATIAAEAAGPTEYRRVADQCFRKALVHAATLNHPSQDISRKLASLHTISGSAALRDATLPRSDQTVVAHQHFSMALQQFMESGDIANTILTSLNISKMELRFAQAFFTRESDLSIQEEERLYAAIYCVLLALFWAQGQRTRGSLPKQQASSGHPSAMHDDSPPFQQAYLHLTNAYSVMINRFLSAFHHGRKNCCAPCTAAPAAVGPSDQPPAPMATEPRGWKSFRELAAQASSGTVKDCERFVHQQLLLPAIHFAKKVGPAAEVRTLSSAVDLHLRAAGVRAPVTDCPHCQPSEAGKCQSLRWAISRSRQLLAVQQKLRDTPVVDLLVALAEGHCVILSCYVQLLKHVKSLVQLELAEEPSLSTDCSPHWEALPKDVNEAQLEVIERAATTLCDTRPILTQLLQNEPELHRVGKMALVEALSIRLVGFVSPILMPLLKMMKTAGAAGPHAESAGAAEKISAIIKRALEVTSATADASAAPQGDRSGGAVKISVELLGSVAVDVFQGKMKKPTSKFF